MDLGKLTRTDRIIAGAGLLLFISAFLPWFKAVAASGTSGTDTGWDVSFIFGGIPALLGLLAAGVVLATKLGNANLPNTSFSTGQAMLGAGALAALLVIIKLLVGEDVSKEVEFVYGGVDVSRQWGIYVAAIAALALAGGGYLAVQEEKSGFHSGPSF